MGYLQSIPGQTLLRFGDVEVRYYLREPSPDVWNAVGVILGAEDEATGPMTACNRMIVGVGSTQEEAVGDLIARVANADHPFLFRRNRPGPESKESPVIRARTASGADLLN